jgi:hypothetical protein
VRQKVSHAETAERIEEKREKPFNWFERQKHWRSASPEANTIGNQDEGKSHKADD